MKVLVLGASLKTDRYSNRAVRLLESCHHEVIAIGNREGEIGEVSVKRNPPISRDIHTVTLYLNPKNQEPYYSYLLDLKPQRVIFNPGTENPELWNQLKNVGIEVEIACTLVLLRIDQFEKKSLV